MVPRRGLPHWRQDFDNKINILTTNFDGPFYGPLLFLQWWFEFALEYLETVKKVPNNRKRLNVGGLKKDELR